MWNLVYIAQLKLQKGWLEGSVWIENILADPLSPYFELVLAVQKSRESTVNKLQFPTFLERLRSDHS